MNFSNTLCLDTEVFSLGDLRTEGTYKNSERSRCLIATYALPGDNTPVLEWDLSVSVDMPQDLRACLANPSIEIAMHNAAYDRVQMEAWGWGADFDLDPRRFLCTMTWAKMNRLPAGLGDLCQVLGVPLEYAKKDGDALIRKFCAPTKKRDGSLHVNTPRDNPEMWANFLEYARTDVAAMRECMKRMPQVFSPAERELYAITEEMNDRGVLIDKELAIAAAFQVTEIKNRYKASAAKEVNDETFNVNSQKALLDYLAGIGIKLDNARVSTIEDFLGSLNADLVPDIVRSLLQTRLKANKSSVAKYATVIKSVNSDERLRGLIQFYGAGTGRDAGRKFQPQNLARPVLLNKKLSMEQACAIVKEGTAELYFDAPMQLLSDTVRGLLIPGKGLKFCNADLASIEGRVLPWLAGEEWKVQYFRDLDAGSVKYDSYELAYSTAFGVDPATVTKAQRALGKPIELATGYGGGVSALITFATLYRINIEDMSAAAREAADSDLYAEVVGSYHWFEEKKLTAGLPREVWAGMYYVVKAWRNKHPATEGMWAQCAEAFRNAYHNQGVVFPVAKGVSVVCNNNWSFMQLPSGRLLVYPMVHEVERPGSRGKQLAYMGVNPFNRKWGTIYTYGGRLAENITQAVARDVMFYNLPRVEKAGYEIVTRVHDEILAEAPVNSVLSGEHLASLISTPHPWCADLPLAAEGMDLIRYQK